jgi:hypothetical protein
MPKTSAVKLAAFFAFTALYLYPLWIGLSSYEGPIYVEHGSVQEVRLTASILMTVLGLPCCFVVGLLLSFLSEQSAFVRQVLDAARPLTFVAIWCLFHLTGILQWFVLLPRLVRRVLHVKRQEAVS